MYTKIFYQNNLMLDLCFQNVGIDKGDIPDLAKVRQKTSISTPIVRAWFGLVEVLFSCKSSAPIVLIQQNLCLGCSLYLM